ncbi:MAG: 50S ribosomal protein L28 [Anaerolineales bacterium]
MDCRRCGKIFDCQYRNLVKVRKDLSMAKCANCGKTTTFGQNRSFSMKATKRKFKPNLQKVQVMENGRLVQKTLCAKCIKRMARV